MSYEQYEHHGAKVWVNSQLKGKHRDFCLCFQCNKLNLIEPEKSCHFAKEIYKNCVTFNVVTPVFECPAFEVKNG